MFTSIYNQYISIDCFTLKFLVSVERIISQNVLNQNSRQNSSISSGALETSPSILVTQIPFLI